MKQSARDVRCGRGSLWPLACGLFATPVTAQSIGECSHSLRSLVPFQCVCPHFHQALADARYTIGLNLEVNFSNSMPVRMKQKRPATVLVFLEPEEADPESGSSFLHKVRDSSK